MSSLQTKFSSDDPRTAACHRIFTVKTWDAIGRSLALSPRELEIIICFFDDDHEQSIADELNISVHTVHTHVLRLYQKLGVHSRVGAVVRVITEYLSLESDCDVCS